MVSEMKLDKSFPVGQYLIRGCCLLFTLDRDKNGRDIMLHVKEVYPM